MSKAFFFDRDGIVLEMVYLLDIGKITTPLKKDDVRYVFGIFDLLKLTKQKGYLNILVSNQPNLGLKKISKKNFEEVRKTMLQEFKKNKISLDAEYYCFHHPFAKIGEYKKRCNCRKPQPGLLFRASKEHNIDLNHSFMIGDGVNDIVAGANAGCKTILVANLLEAEYLRVMEERLKGVRPDYIVKNLTEAKEILKKI